MSALILFDGECNLCNRSVRFITSHDSGHRFQLLSLQSDQARDLLKHSNHDAAAPNTMVLIDAGRFYFRSDAVIRIARRLRFPWNLAAYLLICFPRPLRDAAYGTLARWRYAIFGRTQACPIAPS